NSSSSDSTFIPVFSIIFNDSLIVLVAILISLLIICAFFGFFFGFAFLVVFSTNSSYSLIFISSFTILSKLVFCCFLFNFNNVRPCLSLFFLFNNHSFVSGIYFYILILFSYID